MHILALEKFVYLLVYISNTMISLVLHMHARTHTRTHTCMHAHTHTHTNHEPLDIAGVGATHEVISPKKQS